MSLNIKSVGTSTDKGINSSIQLAVEAAKSCIKKAEVNMQDISTLANVGIYRDENMFEPSMAALIQKGIGMSLDITKYLDQKPSFSFDLMNGAAGAINAFQIAYTLSKTKSDQYFLVVSSDTHPAGGDHEEFPFARVGGAILLENTTDENKGFTAFHFANSKELIAGSKGFFDLEKFGKESKSRIEISTDDEYYERLAGFTAETVKEFTINEAIDLSETLLITTHQTPAFHAIVAEKVGSKADAAINLKEFGDTHSSSFAFGIDKCLQMGLDKAYKQLLFVGATGGLTCNCALYKL